MGASMKSVRRREYGDKMDVRLSFAYDMCLL
jgi:hypothetical protein